MKRKKRKKSPVASASAAIETTAVETTAVGAVEPPTETAPAAPAEVDLATYLPASVRGEPLTKGWL